MNWRGFSSAKPMKLLSTIFQFKGKQFYENEIFQLTIIVVLFLCVVAISYFIPISIIILPKSDRVVPSPPFVPIMTSPLSKKPSPKVVYISPFS